MKLNEDIVESIVASAHAAALGAQPWSAVLQKLAQALGGNGAALFTPVLDPVGRSLAADWGAASEAARAYVQRWVLEDPWKEAASHLGAWRSAGDIATGTQLVDVSVLYRTPFYNDFARHMELRELVSLRAVGDDDPWAPVTHFSIFNSRPRAFENEHVKALQTVWPHLQRAIQTYWVLQKARTSDQAVQHALDALEQPVWVLRADLQIDYSNRVARQWMAAPRGHIAAGGPGNGRLLSIGDVDASTLRLALAQIGSSGGCLLAAALHEAGRLRRATLRMAAVPRNSPYALAWPAAAALLVLHPPPGPEESALWQRHLARRFNLTATESRVLAAIGASHTPDEIAAQLNVSVTTVRSHLARLFDKTGCRRQADLVRLTSGH